MDKADSGVFFECAATQRYTTLGSGGGRLDDGIIDGRHVSNLSPEFREKRGKQNRQLKSLRMTPRFVEVSIGCVPFRNVSNGRRQESG
jgi:hypothetical protein